MTGSYSHLVIDFDHSFTLRFRLTSYPVTQLWLERMQLRSAYPLDDPRRFYGFNDAAVERTQAEHTIRGLIGLINQHQAIIRPIDDVWNQDSLNYLHSVFEHYHGLLDQQTTVWWRNAPVSVQQALANLNIAVHRCESILAGNQPRLVCTWFGMPKTETLSIEDMMWNGEYNTRCGGVYLNYVEIGKTLQELARDNDQYISDAAFQPFTHYSADFAIKFYDQPADPTPIYRYYKQHEPWFFERGYTNWYDIRLQPLNYRVAQLDSTLSKDEVIISIAQRQFITAVRLE